MRNLLGDVCHTAGPPARASATDLDKWTAFGCDMMRLRLFSIRPIAEIIPKEAVGVSLQRVDMVSWFVVDRHRIR